MGNQPSTTPLVPARFLVTNSTECQLLFTFPSKHYLSTIPRGAIVEGGILPDFTEVRVLVDGVSVGVCYKNNNNNTTGIDIVVNKERSVCLSVDKSEIPWVFTVYGERKKISVINNSGDIVTIARPGKLAPLTVRSKRESSSFRDVVTTAGNNVSIKRCYRAVRGEVVTTTHYEMEGLCFDCEDVEDTVIVTIINKRDQLPVLL